MPIPVEFLLFGGMLLGIALFHAVVLRVALIGLAAILAYRLAFTEIDLLVHLGHEWRLLVNLFALLLGFEVLAQHFGESSLPEKLPQFLPDDWKGGFVLLAIVFAMSAMLDNIAAAVIGGTVARVVFRGRVHLGYLAAIVAASNAGGAGSVVGDTTTTMMWIDGVSAFDVMHAAVGSVVALCFFGVFAARQQQAFSPIVKDALPSGPVDLVRVGIVVAVLAGAVAANLLLDFPAVGVWGVLILAWPLRPGHIGKLQSALKGSTFLLALVLSASLMPVETMPAPSWQSTLALGFVSALFDNIPLTALALKQGGFDWGVLAYAVGVGGSMMWFGSSAGVAISNDYPEAKTVPGWLKSGWHVPVGFVLGFFAMLLVFGWAPHAPHRAPRVDEISAPGVDLAPEPAKIDALIRAPDRPAP